MVVNVAVTVSVSVRLSVAVKLSVCVTGGGIDVVVYVTADAREVIVLVVVDILSGAGHVKEPLPRAPPPVIEERVVGFSLHMP